MPGRPPLRRPEFVAREPELRVLEEAWAAARAGRAGVVLLTGEPGIGKSRLVERLLEGIEAADDATVVRAHAVASSELPPLLPIRSALAGLADRPPVPLHRPEDLGDVLDAVTGAVVQRCRSGPVVLAFDDMQWAAPIVWDVLTHLVRAATGARLLVLVTLHAGVLDDLSSPAGHAVAELHRLRLVTHLAVEPLDARAIARLATSVLDAPVAPELGARLAAEAGGNPMLVEELLTGLREVGALQEDVDGWEVRPDWTVPWEGALSLPARLAILARLRTLPASIRDLLEAISVCGGEAGSEQLVPALGRDRGLLDRDVRSAVAAGIVAVSDAGAWRFRHPVVGDVVYREIPDRAAVHARFADALERQPQARSSVEVLSSVARHREAAHDPLGAASAAVEAAALATAAGRVDLALAAAATGQRLAGLAGEPTVRARAALVLADVLIAAGDDAGADDALREASSSGVCSTPLERARVLSRLSGIHRRRGETNQAAGCLEDGVALLGDDPGHRALTAELLVDLSGLERFEGAFLHAQRALELAESEGDAQLVRRAELAVAAARANLDPLHRTIPAMAGDLHAALLGDDAGMAADAASRLAHGYLWSGALDLAEEQVELHLSLLARTGDPAALCSAEIWRTQLDWHRGDRESIPGRLAAAEPVVRRAGSIQPLAFLRYVEALFEYRYGDIERAYEKTTAAIELLTRSDPARLVWYLGLHAWTCHATGRAGELERTIAAHEVRLARLPDESMSARAARVFLGWIYAEVGDVQRAAACEAALRAYSDDVHAIPAHRALAALAVLRGDVAQALDDLSRAEQLALRENMRPELASVHAMRAAIGPTRRRPSSLATARRLMTSLGMRYELSRLPVDVGPAPDGLSPREMDILPLLAEGLTNREIAERLHLSVRTVTNHISSIFAKTGVSNRTAATRYALRQGLGRNA